MNSLQKAYLTIYESKLDERMDPEERALRRAEIADKKAGRMDSSVAKKYADSEAKSAEREDKKSKGKHIAGMADSFEPEGEQIDEISAQLAHTASMKADYMRGKAAVAGDKETAAKKAAQASRLYKGVGPRRAKERMKTEAKDNSYLETDMDKRRKNNEKAIEDMKKTKAHADMVKAVRKQFEELKLDERALDPTETKEKERIVKGMKKSAKDFKARYGDRARSVMYATATKRAKEGMDTSRSDRRYGVER